MYEWSFLLPGRGTIMGEEYKFLTRPRRGYMEHTLPFSPGGQKVAGDLQLFTTFTTFDNFGGDTGTPNSQLLTTVL